MTTNNDKSLSISLSNLSRWAQEILTGQGFEVAIAQILLGLSEYPEGVPLGEESLSRLSSLSPEIAARIVSILEEKDLVEIHEKSSLMKISSMGSEKIRFLIECLSPYYCSLH